MAAPALDRPSVLFIDEAVHGHSTLMASIGSALGEAPPIAAEFVRIPPPRRLGRLLVSPVPGIGDLDLQPVRWRLRYSGRALALARRRRPDAVFANSQSCALLGPRMAGAPPWIVSVDITHRQLARQELYRRPRDRFSPGAERLSERLERRAYGAAHTVIAWTEWTARSLREDYGVPPERIRVMHGGVQLALYGGAVRPGRAPGDPLRLLFIGNQVRRKGIDVVMEAMARLRHPALLDVITADDLPDAPGRRVHHGLTQGSEPFRSLLAAADLFVFPTRGDAVPWVVLEAMAAGLPVIVTAVGAIPELVGDAGVIVPGDPAAVAEAVDALAAAPDRRAELGRRARRRVAEHYDAAVQGPRLFALLERAARGAAA